MKMFVSCPAGRTFDTFFGIENILFAESVGEVVWNPFGRFMTAEETEKYIKDCDVYVSVCGSVRIDEKILEAAPSLKAVIYLGSNALPFVCEETWKRGIKVLTGEQYYSASRAEGTLAYILAALRDIPEYSHRLKYKREWKHSWESNRGLAGKTVGLVNYNSVAEQLARLLSVFDVELAVYDENIVPCRHRTAYRMTQMSMNELFARSDIISIHSPPCAGRYHTINSAQLAFLKKGAIVVDASDGGILNHTALASSLVTGRISAILDLCEDEKLEIDESIFFLSNVTLMPHMSGPTPDIRRHIARRLLQECSEYVLNGIRPKHAVSLSEIKRRYGGNGKIF